MKMRKRPKRLSLIRPDEVLPDLWEMLLAAKSGHRRKVQGLLETDPELFRKEYWYTRPIHFAVREGRLSTVKHLLHSGDDSTWLRYGHEDLVTVAKDRGHDAVADLLLADRQKHNVGRREPIHKAARNGDLDKVRAILLSEPEMLGRGDQEGWTPLHHAVEGGHFDMVALFATLGADVDAIQRGGSQDWYRKRRQRPIDIALRKKNMVMAGFLLAKGAVYTLDFAVAAGDEDRVRALLRGKESREAMGGRPMALAVEAGNTRLVKALLEAGIHPNLPEGRDAPKGTALWKAARLGQHEIAAMLLAAGGDPNQWFESGGSPMHQAKDDQMKSLMYRYGGESKNAADFVLDDNIDALAALIDHDHPDGISRSGCGTVFTYVVSDNKADMLDLLLIRGIRVPSVVTGCRTYLWRQPALTRRLLESGMDPNLPNWQWVTPLHNIAETNPMYRKFTQNSKRRRKEERANRKILVDMFLEFGADINAIEEEYRSTPLGWAARQGEADMVDILLERGADPNGGEAWAKPLGWAERRNHARISGTLKGSGATA